MKNIGLVIYEEIVTVTPEDWQKMLDYFINNTEPERVEFIIDNELKDMTYDEWQQHINNVVSYSFAPDALLATNALARELWCNWQPLSLRMWNCGLVVNHKGHHILY